MIFEDIDPVWLRTMWEDGGTTRDDMIEILISLALLKLVLIYAMPLMLLCFSLEHVV